MEHDLEKIRKRSQLNALMTLVAASLVIGSMVFSFYTLNNMEIKRDALNEEIAKKRAQLDKLGTMLVEASQNQQGAQNEKLKDAAQYYLDVKANEGTLTVTEELQLLQSADDNQLTNEQRKRKEELESVVEGTATIVNDNNIITCASVKANKPSAKKDKFKIAEDVYFWAQLNSPDTETVRLEWINNEDGEVFRKKDYNVALNTDSGYKLWDYKKIRTAGKYTIKLYNTSDHLIGTTEFTVE